MWCVVVVVWWWTRNRVGPLLTLLRGEVWAGCIYTVNLFGGL